MKLTYVSGAIIGLALGFLAHPAWAQSTRAFSTSSAADNAWSSPEKRSYQQRANEHHLGLGLTTSGFIVGGRWEVANGALIEVDAVWRKQLNRDHRIELGGIGRFGFTRDASLIGVGVPARGVLRMHDRWEMNFELILSYTRITFSEPLFPASNGFIPSFRWGMGVFVDPRVSIGFTPLAFSVVTGQRVDPFLTYEPGIWVRYSPI